MTPARIPMARPNSLSRYWITRCRCRNAGTERGRARATRSGRLTSEAASRAERVGEQGPPRTTRTNGYGPGRPQAPPESADDPNPVPGRVVAQRRRRGGRTPGSPTPTRPLTPVAGPEAAPPSPERGDGAGNGASGGCARGDAQRLTAGTSAPVRRAGTQAPTGTYERRWRWPGQALGNPVHAWPPAGMWQERVTGPGLSNQAGGFPIGQDRLAGSGAVHRKAEEGGPALGRLPAVAVGHRRPTTTRQGGARCQASRARHGPEDTA